MPVISVPWKLSRAVAENETLLAGVGIQVCLGTKIELTSSCSLWKPRSRPAFPLISLSNSFPQSSANCEVVIPSGLGILANVSMVAVGIQTDHSAILHTVLNNAPSSEWLLWIQERMTGDGKCESNLSRPVLFPDVTPALNHNQMPRE